jgi:hypothetical protein
MLGKNHGLKSSFVYEAKINWDTLPDHQVCTHCGRDLPIRELERMKTGTYRKTCRKCKYELYSKPAKIRWILKHLHDP